MADWLGLDVTDIGRDPSLGFWRDFSVEEVCLDTVKCAESFLEVRGI